MKKNLGQGKLIERQGKQKKSLTIQLFSLLLTDEKGLLRNPYFFKQFHFEGNDSDLT